MISILKATQFHKLKFERVWYLLILIGLTSLPFFWILRQADKFGLVPTLANLAGFIGALLFLWQFIFGIRFISRKITQDYITMTRLHIFLGSLGTVLVLIHPVLELYVYRSNLNFFFPNFDSPTYPHLLAGQVALSLFVVIWITSAIWREKISYRPWLYIHYFTYPMMALVFFHAQTIGTFLQTYPWLYNYWMFLTGVFTVVVIYRILAYLNLFKAKYKVIKKTNKAGEVTVYRVKPERGRLDPKPGQFVYLRSGFFSEAHPFSVMKSNPKTGVLEFGIKQVGRFTSQLTNLKVGDRVYLDGAYGLFTQEAQNDNPKVLIAGGIGITPFVELVSRFGGKNTYLFYANRTLSEALNRDEFLQILGDNYIEAVSKEKVKDKTIIQGRLNEEVIKQRLPKQFLKQAEFFMCGSPGFMAGVSQSLAKLGVESDRIHMEEFSL